MKTKVAVSLDDDLVRQVDLLVRDARYPSRSQAIEMAIAEHLDRLRKRRLADACAQLDSDEEIALAESDLESDAAAWPPY
jgi:metal-responsive CopG/Arc/MetJ family transcriptional regulator